MEDIFDPFGEEIDYRIIVPDKEVLNKQEGFGRCGISGNGGGLYINEIFENREQMEDFLQKVTHYDLMYKGPTYIKWKEEHNI